MSMAEKFLYFQTAVTMGNWNREEQTLGWGEDTEQG